jgi:hypothetical protein
VLKRTTLKLSADLSESEVRKAIADAMGIPVELVPQLDFESAMLKMKNEKTRLKEIVNEYELKLKNSPQASQDKYEELYDVGRFILASKDNFVITVPDKVPDFPDFVVLLDKKRVAIEHTRLIEEEMKATFKSAKYFIEKTEKLIENELQGTGQTVNIFIDYDAEVIPKKTFKSRNFSIEEREKITQLLADYVRAELAGQSPARPAFILKIKVTPNKDSRLNLELAESYITKADFTQILSKRISSKESKAIRYQKINDFEELWLLLVIDDINSFSGFDLMTTVFPEIKNSNFERIILFEKFGGRIYDLLK